jgi:hypothetical protein
LRLLNAELIILAVTGILSVSSAAVTGILLQKRLPSPFDGKVQIGTRNELYGRPGRRGLLELGFRVVNAELAAGIGYGRSEAVVLSNIGVMGCNRKLTDRIVGSANRDPSTHDPYPSLGEYLTPASFGDSIVLICNGPLFLLRWPPRGPVRRERKLYREFCRQARSRNVLNPNVDLEDRWPTLFIFLVVSVLRNMYTELSVFPDLTLGKVSGLFVSYLLLR